MLQATLLARSCSRPLHSTHRRPPAEALATTTGRDQTHGVQRGDKTAADAARLFRIHPATVCRVLARPKRTQESNSAPYCRGISTALNVHAVENVLDCSNGRTWLAENASGNPRIDSRDITRRIFGIIVPDESFLANKFPRFSSTLFARFLEPATSP